MLHTTIALLLFLLPLAYSPGPGNLVFAATGARFGLRRAGPALWGYHLATWIVTAAIGFGLAASLLQLPAVLSGLKLAGAGFLLWLAIKTLRAGPVHMATQASPPSVLEGALLLILNPKAYVIITLMFAQFGAGIGQTPTATVLIITTIFTANNLIAFSLATLLGARLAPCFASKAGARWLNIGFAALLAAVALWVALG